MCGTCSHPLSVFLPTLSLSWVGDLHSCFHVRGFFAFMNFILILSALLLYSLDVRVSLHYTATISSTHGTGCKNPPYFPSPTGTWMSYLKCWLAPNPHLKNTSTIALQVTAQNVSHNRLAVILTGGNPVRNLGQLAQHRFFRLLPLSETSLFTFLRILGHHSRSGKNTTAFVKCSLVIFDIIFISSFIYTYYSYMTLCVPFTTNEVTEK